MPNATYQSDNINLLTIIGWMNEWSPGRNNPVPKFQRTKDKAKSDIRVKFIGKNNNI